ncbi:MAG: hypothetical protein PHX96_05285 [Candidatus Nanoarchaeia archaeon]|nr:hypothetical protein [Candidatus Nanoarchaeia archaeon]
MTFETCRQLFENGAKPTFDQIMAQCPFAEGFTGGLIGGLIVLGITFAILLGIAIYVYFALAWKTIARKLKYKNSWLAWIPIVNLAMILQLGGFHWAWIFLILIPILGWIALFVLIIIATWRIFEKRKYPGWFSLSMIIPKVGGILYLTAIGVVAWGKK